MPELIITESCKTFLDAARTNDREDAGDLTYTQLIARLNHRAGRGSESYPYGDAPPIYDENGKDAHKSGPRKNP
jgi:hypothetical protein